LAGVNDATGCYRSEDEAVVNIIINHYSSEIYKLKIDIAFTGPNQHGTKIVVIAYLATSYRRFASILVVTPQTVDSQVQKIHKKTGLRIDFVSPLFFWALSPSEGQSVFQVLSVRHLKEKIRVTS
jgi:hypothetical protein